MSSRVTNEGGIRQWARTTVTKETVGMQRYGNPSDGCKGASSGHGEIHGLTLLTDLLDRIGRSSRFFLEVDRNVNGVWIRISREESWGRKKEPLPGTITPRLQLRV